MNGPLAGLTVLECPGGVATRYCGRLFAAHGATVLQAGSPAATGVGYGGDASADPSTSAPLTQTIVMAASSTTVIV